MRVGSFFRTGITNVELRSQKSAEELPVLRRVPDVQDFNGVVFHAVGDDVRQPPVQQFAGAFLTSLASTLGKLFKRADGFTDFNDGGLR